MIKMLEYRRLAKGSIKILRFSKIEKEISSNFNFYESTIEVASRNEDHNSFEAAFIFKAGSSEFRTKLCKKK